MDDTRARCRKCLFGHLCYSSKDCDDYAPIEYDDSYYDDIAEQFRKEIDGWWYEYANEYN